MGKIQHRLYHCIVCGEEKSRRKFDARGRSRHICKDCYELPAEVRSEAVRMDTLNWITFKQPKTRKDWGVIEQYAAQYKDKESGRLAQEYLEENSSHYKAKVAKKEQRRNRNQWYIDRKSMRTLAEQIVTTYAIFKENADLQLSKSNKSAGLRARKASMEMTKLLKEFRRLSVVINNLSS